ncbi:MAG: pyruvate kinase [bacterium]|nr:pyruvate kinase [bacterium]
MRGELKHASKKASDNHLKRTKILATVGPSTNSYEAISEMIINGANGFRLNFSHGTHDEKAQHIKWIREASKKHGRNIAIVQDLQGPKIRCGDFDGIINIKSGQDLQFRMNADYSRSGIIPTQYDLSKKVKRGERMYIYDGKIRTVVTSITNDVVHARAQNDGIIIERKGINLPDTDFGGDVITTKDKTDIAFGSEHDIDYVALSFVQTHKEVEWLQNRLKILGSKAKVIAKIETNAAIENIDEIMEAADAVMIARGDLAIETLPESVPVVQRHIIGLGMKYKKPTIVATQMLASMTETPEPTRAEVSDVATAVIVGADCVMLSDETANGRYPLEAVRVMRRVIMYTQENSPLKASFQHEIDDSKQTAISNAIITLAENIGAEAVVAETKSGATALSIAAQRPELPIIAVTPDAHVAQQLAIVYGSQSYLRDIDEMAITKLSDWLEGRKVFKKGDIIVTASGQYPGAVGTTDTIKVRVL